MSKKSDKLKGVFVNRWDEREAMNVKLKDNKLAFEISGGKDGNEFKFIYTGKPRGNSIKGTFEYNFNGNTGSNEFNGMRIRETKKTKKEE